MGTIKHWPNAGVCLCSRFSYPVELNLLFMSEPLTMHFLCICEMWNCGCSGMTVHMCMLVWASTNVLMIRTKLTYHVYFTH